MASDEKDRHRVAAMPIDRFWGKLGQKAAGGYHPLLCHMLDVAAVAERMWSEVLSPATRRAIVSGLGMEDGEESARWVAFLAGLHDLGKASPAFQLREEASALRPMFLEAGFHDWHGKARDAPHGVVTAATLPELLAPFGVNERVARRLSQVTGGHHGIFPPQAAIERLDDRAIGKGRWPAARVAFVETLAEVLRVTGNGPRTAENAAAMALAGLISVADWIGSNADPDLFAYQPPPIDPADYLTEAGARAGRAILKLVWRRHSDHERRPFKELFPEIASPYPLQSAIDGLAARQHGPALVILEAPMGEGKTEAALTLTDAWAIDPGASGFYIALPTQATSNQMFGRVRRFLEERFPGEKVQLQLLHGQASLSAEFELLRRAGEALFAPSGVYDDEGEETGSVLASEWFTYRKRGLLAPFGVGTVDQALLAVLQSKHVFVRLFGLSGKAVVVDEVHAYDAYMSTLLERLLEWLGALGTPTALLSATLPAGRRARMVAAYRRGLVADASSQSPARPVVPGVGEQNAAGEGSDPEPAAAYPRITWATQERVQVEHVPASPRSTRTLRLEWVGGEPSALGERLSEGLAGGGCAAVICNTVARAQTVFEALRAFFPREELMLFHARFRFLDRDRREREALRSFGKDSGAARPRRAVLVATQVIEQSLDLDFDLLVTEIAPVDLVLQRAGRLWRHDRPERPVPWSAPTLWVCGVVERDGAPQFDRGTAAVFDGHVLLRSWLALRGLETIVLPGDLDGLIAAVYDEAAPPSDATSALLTTWERTRAEQDAALAHEEREAKERWVNHPAYDGALWRLTLDAREEDAPEFHPAHQALTRLEKYPSVPVVLLTQEERAGLRLGRPPDRDTVRFLLERSVRLSGRRLSRELLALEPPRSWQRSALLRHHRLVELDANGRKTLEKTTLRLDPELGVCFGDEGEEA